MDLSGVGVWSSQLRYGDPAAAAEAAAELEELGFTALWIPDVGGQVFDSVGHLLSSTQRVVIATGILNLWMHEPSDVAATYASLTATHGERFLLGIGVSHAPLIDSKEPGRYRKPLAATRAYLDALDATDQPVPVSNRVLAALGPKMLELPRHVPAAPTPIWSPLTTRARPVIISATGPCCCPNRRLFSPMTDHKRVPSEPIGSVRIWRSPTMPTTCCAPASRRTIWQSVTDRLFDAIIAWGDEESVLRRVNEHLAAGADHVCVQALTANPRGFPREQWRRLAAALC